ncbi:ER auxin binding protein 1 precursor [Capsicum annuum]|nr:ER auxin binding protein 1 precursor [Capsicum annuum]KAF3673684.1 ER auxin binding protein 1 precursor [Capsicum annuum]
MESEFIALDKVGEEAEWIQNFFKDILYWPKLLAPVCIHCDSQATLDKAGSMMYNGKSHHIRRRHNTVRELRSNGIITVDYVKSKDNVSDPLTKGLSRVGVERTSKGMSLRPMTMDKYRSTDKVSYLLLETNGLTSCFTTWVVLKKATTHKEQKSLTTTIAITTTDPLSLSSSDTNNGELERLFTYFDENGDGKVSPVDLRRCMKAAGGALTEEEAEMAVRLSDSDGDGLLVQQNCYHNE